MVEALHKLDDLNGNQENSAHKESPDDLFGKLIGQSIAEIPDEYKKEVLKVQIQQIILHMKFMTSQQNPVNNTNTMQSFGSPPENASNNVHNMNRFDSSFRTYEHF